METELTRGLGRGRTDQPTLRAVRSSDGEIDLTERSDDVVDLTVSEARDALFSAGSGRTLHVPERNRPPEPQRPTGLRRFLRRRTRTTML